MKKNQKHLLYKGSISGLVVVLSFMIAACSSPSATAPAPQSSAPPAQSPAANAPASPQRQGANGTIASISGNTLTLTTTQGQAKVNISSNTIIEKTITGTLSDLTPGQTLVVTGTPDSNGNVVATTIAIRPQGQNTGLPAPSGRPNGGGGNGTGGGNGGGPRASTNPAGRGYIGTLTTINGSTLTITTAQTTTPQITAIVAPTTTIEKTMSGTLADLSVGNYLTVFGTADSSGVITAVNITDRPQGPGPNGS